MKTWHVGLLLGLGALLVLVSVAQRVRWGTKYEVKTTDLVLLIVPLIVVALMTGRVKGLDLFGVKADLSELWTQAAKTEIQRQVAPAHPVSVQDVVQAGEMALKGGTSELQRIVERKADTLAFRLGEGAYYGPAIRTYLETLSGSSHLRSVIVLNRDNTLFGIYVAADLIGYLKVRGDSGYAELQSLLNSGSEDARAKLAKWPGFVGVDGAVTVTTSKKDALAAMARLDVDLLPVVDGQRRFVGTITRSKLTSSMILAVTERIEGSP